MNRVEENREGYPPTQSILQHSDAECDVTQSYQGNIGDNGHLNDVIIRLPQQYPTMNSPIECGTNSGSTNVHYDNRQCSTNVFHSGSSAPVDIIRDGAMIERAPGSVRTVSEIEIYSKVSDVDISAVSMDKDKGDREVLDGVAEKKKEVNIIIDGNLNVPSELSEAHNKLSVQHVIDPEARYALTSNSQNVPNSTGAKSSYLYNSSENEIKSNDVCRNSIVQDLSRSMQYFIGPRVSPKYESLKDALKDG